MNKCIISLGAAGLAAMAFAAELPAELKPPVECAAEKNVRLEWWREARFGMFIHWGVYAALAGSWNGQESGGAGEWIMIDKRIPCAEYMKYSQKFNPVNYDPDEWVQLAQRSGMKYIVITSKHHDGFALFDSKATDWDVVDATPWKKDLLKPLVEAAHRHGMRIGFYYSQFQDWHHPGGGAYRAKWDKAQEGDLARYVHDIAIPQVREILANYGKIDILWWDTPGKMTPELCAPLFKLAHDLQPGIITNDRLGGGFPGDSATPEQYIPATGMDRDFEVCMTLNNTWGYKEQDNNWKSVETVIKNLCDISSKGGNYLLNMGPRADGTIPQPIRDAFTATGEWLKTNGEAIYATTASPFRKQFAWGRCTKRFLPDGTLLYLHVFNWPEGGKLFLPGLRNRIDSAKALWGDSEVKTENAENGVAVTVADRRPGNLEKPEVVVVKARGTLDIFVAPLSIDPSAAPATLDIADAETTGSIKSETSDRKANLGFWINAADTVSWSFRIPGAGKYAFSAPIACEGDSQVQVLIDGAVKATLSVPSTGGYKKYSDVALLAADLPGGKEVKLTLRPVAGKWSPLNVRGITVKKAE